jgi:hypothetical protein
MVSGTKHTVVVATAAAAVLFGGTAASAGGPAPTAPPAHTAAMSGTGAPVFAYYYMWMNGTYWTKNKLDYPVRPFPGDYNSADRAVIDWQIRQAEAAGISGFIVSWKDTTTYRTIVPELEAVADSDNFKLAMDYEGLDAQGHPLPVSKVAADFAYFTATYAPDPAWYRVGGKPLTIWNGTVDYPASAVAAVTTPLRSRLLILNSANSVPEYQRLAPYTDGDAYYWSSVNPATNPGWVTKLQAMGAAVHQAHGLWIPSFAPGFNATLIGGHIIVPRDNGATLATEYAGATASSPDILGLISWNEWTENTYTEPSASFGYSYVGFLKSLITG